MTLVSVLVPVYNVEKYLPQCLDSILAQTLSNIEVICVNDGSTDSSAEILKRYAANDNRIKIITKPNGGLPSARNAGIKAAAGEYVSFIDADDYIQPDMMKKLYNAAKKDNSEIVICGANVFPTDPAPDGWLINVLSPVSAYYETGDEELLFENKASRPFIWRTFMKRELLVRTDFQLNESIHIGEDNAFQFRIYPQAKGITLIPDKLYNYRWYREDSMMNSVVYKDTNKKCIAHIKMILHIAEEWIKSGDMKTMGKEFLSWSVDFLYDDFIKMPLEVRIENAELLTRTWTKAGFFKYQYSFSDNIRDMFKYFYVLAEEKTTPCDLSVVISTDADHRYFEDTVKSCLEQDFKNIELIIVNNGSGEAAYSIIHKYLHKDKRVRVYNTSKSHYTVGYNTALGLCQGKYMLFVRPDDWLHDKETLGEWFRQAEEQNSDIVLSPCSEAGSVYYSSDNNVMAESDEKKLYVGCMLGNALFRTDFIRENELEFENYSIESGKVFLAAAYLAAKNVSVINKEMYISRIIYKQDWIPTEQCVLVLKSFADRLELAEKYNAPELHNKVFSLLVNDYYMNLLINNTRPYFMSMKDCPEGENSQSKVLEQLLRILALIDPDMLPENNGMPPVLPLLFSKFVDERNKFTGNMSDEYMRV